VSTGPSLTGASLAGVSPRRLPKPKIRSKLRIVLGTTAIA
jgi:hypothetical protein